MDIDGLRLMGISIAEHELGHELESQQALDALIAKGAAGWAYQAGEVYAWRGENDKALEWFERAYQQEPAQGSTLRGASAQDEAAGVNLQARAEYGASATRP